MPNITQAEIDVMRNQGRAVAVYPIKKLVIVDGWKRFKLVEVKK